MTAANGTTRRTSGKKLVIAAAGAMMIAAAGSGAVGTAAASSNRITGPGGTCADAASAGTAGGAGLRPNGCADDRTWTPLSSAALDPAVPPGGNFDLSVWELQLPIGSPGSPTTIPPSRLKGANGYTNAAYFWTDKNDGSMTFWDPESGVTTPNSSYPRSELREMNADGSAADWSLSGTHRLSARLRIVSVTSNVCVGQIHLGSGGPSTKPLLELYYHSNGDIVLGLEKSPDGGQTLHTLANVALGTQWSYVIAIVGGQIQITVNGSTTSYPIASGFGSYHQYFKAGDYNQSASDSTSKGAKVKFYALTVAHG